MSICTTAGDAAASAQFARVAAVIHKRCTVCHSAHPTNPLFASAPGGVMLDSPGQIRILAPKIQALAVASQLMPLGNVTGMTPEERELIGAWIAAGARID